MRSVKRCGRCSILHAAIDAWGYYGGCYRTAEALEKKGLLVIDRSNIPYTVACDREEQA